MCNNRTAGHERRDYRSKNVGNNVHTTALFVSVCKRRSMFVNS